MISGAHALSDPAAVEATAIRLTSIASVSRSADEVAFAPQFREIALELLGEGANAELLPVGKSDLRASVLAHVRGSGRDAVLLCGHFDTVPIDDYAKLRAYALNPMALRTAMIQAATGEEPSTQVTRDLDSGEFLPGRGLLDMKSGLAAGLHAAELFARLSDRKGHVLFLATPDEEIDSLGIRSAIPQVKRYCETNGLDLRLAINLDALTDRGDGADGQTFAFGNIGKLLLSAFVIGKETHASYPFDGVSAGFIGGALSMAFECNPDLAEGLNDEYAAPPTLLAGRDLKPIYNVTTPASFWGLWNVTVQKRSADEVLKIAQNIARKAIDQSRQTMKERGTMQPVPVAMDPMWNDIPVLRYDELFDEARRIDRTIDRKLSHLATALRRDPQMDTPTVSRAITERVFAAAGRSGPCVILGFASTPYFATQFPTDENGRDLRKRLAACVERTSVHAATPIRCVDFLPIISDMSFLGAVSDIQLSAVAASSPAWGVDIEPSSMQSLGIPAINLGPWGRDYHHPHERVARDYAFRVLPELVFTSILTALDP